MKSTRLVLSSFLLFAFVVTKPSLAAHEPVLDMNGEEVIAGTKYYVWSIYGGALGGDVTATNKTSPLDAIRGSPVLYYKCPVTFRPANSEEVVIRVSTDLNIKFYVQKVCNYSQVWEIQKSPNPEIQWFVTPDGVEGNPGCETVNNWFKIEKGGEGTRCYKLAFCPLDICPSVGLCRDIGIILEKGGRIMSLNDKLQPFLVMFGKAESLSSSI